MSENVLVFDNNPEHNNLETKLFNTAAVTAWVAGSHPVEEKLTYLMVQRGDSTPAYVP